MAADKMAADHADDSRTRTFLWGLPRSVSCAFTRAMSAIDGIEVWYEPFFFSFVAKLESKKRLDGLEIPRTYEGNEETFQKVAQMMKGISHCTFKPDFLSYGSVKQNLSSATGKHVFVKDMGFTIGKDDFQFIPDRYRHTFMIRHPLRVFRSNRKAMFDQLSRLGFLEGTAADETTFDLEHDDPYVTPGLLFKDLYDVWQHVRENIDSNPIVIDAEDLLANPAKMLTKYCSVVGLPYDESLLDFGGSSKVELNKIWKAPIGSDELKMSVSSFSRTAMESSGFLPANEMPSRDQLTPDVIRCADKSMAYYDEMYESRMKI